MSDSKYPVAIDTDAEIPRVDDNITEIGGEVIDAIRDAIFAIEATLGVNPQGSSTDLKTRISVSIDNSGNLKASALASAGLVTLPITNSQIASSAGIEESKLDLDHSTALLQTSLDSLNVLLASVQSSLMTDIANMIQHTAHPGVYGRHYASDIDVILGSSPYNGSTVQVAVDTNASDIDSHITDMTDAHDASAISVDNTNFQKLTDTNVQDTLESLEGFELKELRKHRDRQHSNGILKSNNVKRLNHNHNTTIISSTAARVDSGSQNVIKFTSAPSALLFNSIKRNDRVDFILNGIVYTRIVDSIEGTNEIYLYNHIQDVGTGTVTVYKNQEIYNANASLKIAVRNSKRAAKPAVLQLIHPDSAYIIGNKEYSNPLSATHKNIRIDYYNGNTGDIDIYTKMLAFSAIKSTWTVENIAKILNEEVFAPTKTAPTTPTHYPLIAFVHEGNLGIAYDEPGENYYVEIGIPSSDSASEFLGLTEGNKAYGTSPKYIYEDGYEYKSIRKILDSYAVIHTPDTLKISNIDLLKKFNLPKNTLIRVDGSAASGVLSGTFVSDDIIKSGNDTLIEFDSTNELDFPSGDVNKGINVRIYSDFISENNSSLPSRMLYEVFVDGYEGSEDMELFSSVRVDYNDTSGGGFSIEDSIDIVSVSRTFEKSELRLFYDNAAHTITLGSKSGVTITNPGDSVTVPTPGTHEEGKRYRVYDSYNVNYIDIEIAKGLPSGNANLDVTIYNPISEEYFVQIGTFLYDKSRFFKIEDRRLFGSVGRYDVRDDFTRDYIDFPRSLLRGNGVIRGLKTETSTVSSFIVGGGEVLVNGSIFEVLKKEFFIPDASQTYNVFVDSNGFLQMKRNDFYVDEVLTTQATVDLVNSTTETIISVVTSDVSSHIDTIEDYRRFVGNIDNKLDIIVEENTITHSSFASLRAAFNWITAHDNLELPVSRVVKIRGRVNVDLSEGPIKVPDGVVLKGDTLSSTAQSDRSELFIYGSITGTGTLFNVAGSFSLVGLALRMSAASLGRFISNDSTGITSDISIENCEFYNITSGSLVESGAISNYSIVSTKITTSSLYAGDLLAKCVGPVDNLLIEKCIVEFPLTSYAISLADIATISNSTISNNIFKTTGVNITYGFKFTTLSNSIIENCIFDNIHYSSITIETVESSTIKNNIFSNVNSSTISFTSQTTKSFIINNIFSTSSTPSHFISITNGIDVSIIDNKMSSSIAITSVTGSMIEFKNSSDYIIISNNTLLNPEGDNFGFKYGIYFDGGAGSVAYDHRDTFIIGNEIKFFSGPNGSSTTRGINIKNAEKIKISDNSINTCSEPIYLYDSTLIHINNNFIASVALFAEKPCLTIDGSSSAAVIETLNIISNNIFFHYGNPVLSLNSEVISIKNISSYANAYFGIISGNTFLILASASAKNIIIADATVDSLNISNNIFRSSVPIVFSVSPINLAGDNCYVALNSIENITLPAAGAITLSGTNSSNILNKGENYTKIIPASSMIITSVSNWVYDQMTLSGTNAVVKTPTVSATDYLYIDIKDIPNGAIITDVGIYYYINAGGGSATINGSLSKMEKGGVYSSPATILLNTSYVNNSYESVSVSSSFNVDFNAEYYLRLSVGIGSGAISLFAINRIDIYYTL